MKKIIALFVSVLLITGTVVGVNAIVYHYGAGGPDMTLNFYVDSSEVETTTFTEIEIIIKSSFSTYEDKTVIFNGKRVNIGNVKAESTLEGALITTGYTESQGAVTTFMFKSNEGVEISNNQPILSIINVNSVLYSSLDSIDYSVEKLVALDGTDYADKNIVKTDLIIPESTNPTLPAVGSLYVNNIKESDDSTNPSSSESQPSSSESQPTNPSTSESQPTESGKTDISNWTVDGLKDVTYTGKVIKPEFDVVNVDGEYAEFNAAFKNNKNVGTATVTIIGTGDYTGSIVKTFKITKAKNPMTITAQKSVNAKAKKKTVIKKTVTVKKVQGKVTYKTNNKKVTVKNGSITVAKGLKKGKTYKVKITVKAAGNSNYKSASKTVTVKIKVK